MCVQRTTKRHKGLQVNMRDKCLRKKGFIVRGSIINNTLMCFIQFIRWEQFIKNNWIPWSIKLLLKYEDYLVYTWAEIYDLCNSIKLFELHSAYFLVPFICGDDHEWINHYAYSFAPPKWGEQAEDDVKQ